MTFTLQPVTGNQLVGREQVVKEMLKILEDKKSNTGYALYGIRRVGKTSILKEIESKLAKKRDFVVIYISLWSIIPFNLESFLEIIITTTLEKYKKILPLKYKTKELLNTPVNVLRQIIGNLKLSFKIREDLEFLLSFKSQKELDYKELFKKAFSFQEQLASTTKIKCILILDEFPTILELKIGKDLVRALRTLYEEQKHVAMCISGSTRKTIDAVALSETSPFYKQFIAKEIKPLKEKDVEKIFKNNAKEYNIKIEHEAINLIYMDTKGIPFYVQFLGKLAIAKRFMFLDLNSVKKLIKAFLEEEGNTLFLDYIKYFSSKEQEILKAIAKGAERVTIIAKQTKTSPNTISTYLLYLIDKGAIEKKGRGRYDFIDPMFKEWLKQRFGK